MITDVPAEDGDPDIREEKFFQESLKEEPENTPSMEDRMASMEVLIGQLVTRVGELTTSTNSVGAMVEDAVTSVTQATETFNNGGMSRIFKGVFGNV